MICRKNIGMLLAFRFLTGFIGSPVLATGGASLADIWSPKKNAYAIGVWALFAVCGPVMGPLIGGFAAQAKGWTWVIWELVWLSGFCFVVLTFTLPETSAATILFQRTRRLRRASGNKNLKCEADVESENMQVKDLILSSLGRPFQLCFQEPILLALNVYLGLIYALLYTWFEAFPIVFVGIYHFNLGQNGLAFLGILVGSVIIMIPYSAWLYFVQEKQFDENGTIEPEKRLPPATVGAIFIPICMFWFGWSSRTSIHWIMPVIGSAIFPAGAVLLFNAILNYQGDAYPK
jgi:DHA1 family multidrug resistance protein-like MFS transporter